MKLHITSLKEYISYSIMISLSLFIVGIANALATSSNTTGNDTITSVYEITTRGNLDKPEDSNETGYMGKYPFKNTEEELLKTCPPKEVVIFVHGWFLDAEEAKEKLDRVKMSLEHNDYNNIL